MTGDQRKQIRFELERRLSLSPGASVQEDLDGFMDWLDGFLLTFKPGGLIPPLAKGGIISADPLGADRARRTISPFDGIGAPPDFGRKSA